MAASSTIADGLDKSKLHFVEAGGIRARYYEDGEGEPLVLFSGGEFGSLYTLDAFSLNLPELARHFHVYAIDKPGQGFSDGPPTDADYTFEWLLTTTHAILRALSIEQAHILGHSRGALLVARLAIEYPELVKSILLVDTFTLAPFDPTANTDDFYDEILRQTPPGPPTRETVRLEPDAQSFSKAHITEDFVSRMHEIALRPGQLATDARMRELRTKQWHPSLYGARDETLAMIADRGLPAPTLLVWAYDDRSAPLRLAYSLFDLIARKTPQAELHVINQAGHYVYREQVDAFNRLIRAFCLG